MPVTVYPAPHPSEPCALVHLLRNASPEQVLRKCTAIKLKEGQVNAAEKLNKIWSSSFGNEEHIDIYPSANGFVHGTIRAYNAHHHLRTRPDDVWIAIMSQLSIYVNKNSEALRSVFVSHQGKKALDLDGAVLKGFDQFASKIQRVLAASVKDPSVTSWIMQEFSTTTPTDRIAAGIIMMATFQSYFKYFDACTCGLPSVTLLGTREDWVKLLNAVDRLATFVPKEEGQSRAEDIEIATGPAVQIKEWVFILKPVLNRFIRSFDYPGSDETIAFWQQVADYRVGGSGADYLSGWLTAFCFWNEKGDCNYPLTRPDRGRLVFDGVGYAAVDWEDVPPGWATVPLEIDFDDGKVYKCRMLAGSVGITPFLAKVEGSVNGTRDSTTKSSIPPDNKTHNAPTKSTSLAKRTLQKVFGCCAADSAPTIADQDQEIVLPPYRPRPLREPRTLSYDKKATSDFECGGYDVRAQKKMDAQKETDAQQKMDNPPPYRLDGVQPRIGWWLWEEEVVVGNAPL